MVEKINFNKEAIARLEPKISRYEVEDLKTPGLRITVFPSGVKTYYLLKLIKGKSQRIKVGRCSDISIEMARYKANNLKAQITLGNDPKEELKRERNQLSLSELYELYYKQHSSRFTKTAIEYKKTYYRRIHPLLGNDKVSLLTKKRINEFFLEVAEKYGQSAANKVLTILSFVINFGIKNEFCSGPNPCSLIKKFKRPSRDRFLSRTELQLFTEAVDAEGDLFRDYFQVLLFTGARKTNVLSMRWQDIDFDLEQWRIIEAHSKNSEKNLVHLSSPVLEILYRRHEQNTKLDKPSPFVFPGEGNKGHLADPKRSFNRIRKRMNVHNIVIHDLRRTLGSYMAMSGASLPIIGEALNHKSQDATKIYARFLKTPISDAITIATETMQENWLMDQFRRNMNITKPSRINHITFVELIK